MKSRFICGHATMALFCNPAAVVKMATALGHVRAGRPLDNDPVFPRGGRPGARPTGGRR